ncbi:hypothetical protein, partial [Klebsiella aerogenes]|uniref:hypothetical protein n=1 Tax=Klebsiella aerogenes TaxID=548 RepID=UPI0019536275
TRAYFESTVVSNSSIGGSMIPFALMYWCSFNHWWRGRTVATPVQSTTKSSCTAGGHDVIA